MHGHLFSIPDNGLVAWAMGQPGGKPPPDTSQANKSSCDGGLAEDDYSQ